MTSSDTTQDSPALWLMMDSETSGLLRTTPAGDRVVVLEAAWMVVNAADLTQLTPLRQRITALWELPSWRDRAQAWSRLRPVSPWLIAWDEIPMHPKAREMHEQTGLARDWAAHPSIRDVRELDRLIRADVDTAREKLGGPEARVHLAGPGVAQFEDRLLPRIGSQVTSWCHYRTADTSVASMVAGVPKVDGASWEGVTSLDLQSGLAAAEVGHRAAGDVLLSYAMARRLRAAVLG